MQYPKVAIGIITYNRLPELLKVIRSIIGDGQTVPANLIYPPDKLTFILADDGSGENYIKSVRKAHPSLFDDIIVNNRKGMGANWNSMIKMCEARADYTVCLQDDWLFTAPVHLEIAVKFMEHNPDYGMLRYHKLTGHVGLPAVVKEWDTRQAFHGYFHSPNEYVPEMLPFMELLPPFDNSDTYSPYSGGVHLRHRDFTKFYGEYPEGAGFSNTEMEFMRRVNHALRFNLQVGQRHRVAMFPAYFESRFRDLCIGKSYRGTVVEGETLNVG